MCPWNVLKDCFPGLYSHHALLSTLSMVSPVAAGVGDNVIDKLSQWDCKISGKWVVMVSTETRNFSSFKKAVRGSHTWQVWGVIVGL